MKRIALLALILTAAGTALYIAERRQAEDAVSSNVLEADREGLLLAAMAGYSPQGAVDLMNAFVRLDRQYVAHS